MHITISFSNPNPETIWNRHSGTKSAARLGRLPTPAEAAAEVKRILAEAKSAREERTKD